MRKVGASISELRSVIVELENLEGDVDLNPTQVFATTEDDDQNEVSEESICRFCGHVALG